MNGHKLSWWRTWMLCPRALKLLLQAVPQIPRPQAPEATPLSQAITIPMTSTS